MRNILFFSLLVSFYAMQGQSVKKNRDDKAPNIIFILTDDLGYGDLGVLHQNSRRIQKKPYHKTPNLDIMAGNGLLLTRHYAPAPVCAPSRASLLQGVHQGHAEIRNNQFDKALSNNHTLATVLKQAGYTTGLIGKWGLQGKEGNSPQTWESFPTKRGFDYFLGYVRHVDGHNHYPAHKAERRSAVELYDGEKEISKDLKGVYTTDLFAATAKKWIVEQERNENPFFLEIAFDTPHAGLQVPASPYPKGGGLDGGLRYLGKQGNFINTADTTIDDFIHPDYVDKQWPQQQKRYATMVRRIDNTIGDILKLLKDLEIDKETLIVFSSDNGPHNESYGYGDFDPTFFQGYGVLDGIKRDTWEGGIRIPTIAYWPGKIKEGKDDTPTAFYDWLPTFAELGGLPAPANSDGVSLVPLLTGDGEREEGLVYIEYNHTGATPNYADFNEHHAAKKREEMQVLYLNGYKGVRLNIESADSPFAIYNTRKDPGEEYNLAGTNVFFDSLQVQMQKKSLRIRRPNASAPRPYDAVPIPAIELNKEAKAGLVSSFYELETPWVPDIHSLNVKPRRERICNSLDIQEVVEAESLIIDYTGYIEIPETGKYKFYLNTSGNAVMRLHGATLFDADKGYISETTIEASIYLEEGYHPLHLTTLFKEVQDAFIEVEYMGNNNSKKELSSLKFIH